MKNYRQGEDWRELFERVVDHATDHLDRLDDGPVAATATPEKLRARLSHPLKEEGLDPELVIEDLVADTEGGIQGSGGGRFYAWVIGGTQPAAMAADWLASAWDQNAGMFATAPAASMVEEIAGGWLKEILRLPAGASFAMVSGCQMAHLTCLAAARHGVLEKAGWDVEKRGLFGAPKVHIVANGDRHGSVERAVRLLGFGTDSMADLPTDDENQLQPETLAAALEERKGEPVIVVLQAGDLNIGAFDPFEKLIPLAHEHGAWVHVDGAFGLWANTTPEYRHLLAGVERADSWATDGHKWLNTTYDCGYAFVAHPEPHRAALAHMASYLTYTEDARDGLSWNPEWSRRARGFATYAVIRQLGKKGIGDVVARCCRHTRDLAVRLGELEGAELITVPQLNQGLVRFHDPAPGATEADHDQFTNSVIKAAVKTGEVFFGGTTWRGRRCMRISMCNWRTDQAAIDRAVAAVEEVLADFS